MEKKQTKYITDYEIQEAYELDIVEEEVVDDKIYITIANRGTVCMDLDTNVILWQELIMEDNNVKKFINRNAQNKIDKIKKNQVSREGKVENKTDRNQKCALQRTNIKGAIKNMSKFLAIAVTVSLIGTAGYGLGYKKGKSENPTKTEPVEPVISQNFNTINTVDPDIAIKYVNGSYNEVDNLIASIPENELGMRDDWRNEVYEKLCNVCSMYDDLSSEEIALPGEVENANENFYGALNDYENWIIKRFGSEYSFANSPFANAVKVDGTIYILDSGENYEDGKLPEGSYVQEGYLYVPCEDSAIIKGM